MRDRGVRTLVTSGVAIAALLIPVLLPAQTPDGPTILGRASRIYRALGSYQAEFQEHVADPTLGNVDYKGIIAQAGQNNFAMRYTDPANQAIILDGTYLWVYTPAETPTQVLRMQPPTGPTFGDNTLGYFLDNPTERYHSSWVRDESVDGHMCEAVLLIPNTPDARFRRATIWLDKESSLPRRLEYQDRSNVTYTLNFTKVRANLQISPDMFKFIVPKGVKVIPQ